MQTGEFDTYLMRRAIHLIKDAHESDSDARKFLGLLEEVINAYEAESYKVIRNQY